MEPKTTAAPCQIAAHTAEHASTNLRDINYWEALATRLIFDMRHIESISKGQVREVARKALDSLQENHSPIAALNLTVKIRHSLMAENILTVGQLLTCSRNTLLKIPNLGKVSLMEIEGALKRIDLNLASESTATWKS